SDKSPIPGLPLFLVDGDWTQGEMDRLLYKIPPGAPNALSIYQAQPIEHKAYLEELLNEHRARKLSKRTNEWQVSWQRKDENRPNDLRDCDRYADVIALVWLGGDEIPTRGEMLAAAGFTTPAVA